jgi:hypothetical protein
VLQPTRIQLPTVATSIAISGNDLIVIEMRANWDRDREAKFECYDTDGNRLWTKDLLVSYPHALKIADDGLIWIGSGASLDLFDLNGNPRHSFPLRWADGEDLGAFLIGIDGFYVCSRRSDEAGNLYETRQASKPKVMHYDLSGQLLWSTTLPINPIEFTGLIEAGVHTEWKIQPKKSWHPREWRPDLHYEPIMLSDERLIVSYVEYSSGLGVTYCLDANSGSLLWTTPPSPLGNRIIFDEGKFLIGSQGYGAFDTWLYDRDGTILQHWPSHGDIVLTREGQIRVVEMENVLPSKMHFSIFHLNGEVQKGPHLERYYTTYPVITRDKTTTFWREGDLITVDKNLNKQVLYSDSTTISNTGVLSRMLLSKRGKIVFTRANELWIFDAQLGSLEESVWPCVGGNIGGNPVLKPA